MQLRAAASAALERWGFDEICLNTKGNFVCFFNNIFWFSPQSGAGTEATDGGFSHRCLFSPSLSIAVEWGWVATSGDLSPRPAASGALRSVAGETGGSPSKLRGPGHASPEGTGGSGSSRSPFPVPSADERFDATFHTNVLVNSSGHCQYLPPGEAVSSVLLQRQAE